MKANYYTKYQAIAICAAHQYLVGQPFDPHIKEAGIIENVVVAPYSRIMQWKFVQLLQQGIPPHQALTISPNERYDVVLITTQAAGGTPGKPGIRSVRTHYEEQRLPFKPSDYIKRQ